MDFTMDMFRLDGKVALITGAIYGIGFEIAEALAKAGATIVFNSSRQSSVDQGIASYQKAGIKAKGYVCDVTDKYKKYYQKIMNIICNMCTMYLQVKIITREFFI